MKIAKLVGRDAGLGVRKHPGSLRSGVRESHWVKGLVIFKGNWMNLMVNVFDRGEAFFGIG